MVDSNILPYPDNYFDFVVAWESICYNNEDGLKEVLDEILRVLKPGGKFLSTIPRSIHFLCGREVAPNVFQPTNTSDQTECVLYAFKNREQAKEMYKKFKNRKIGYYSANIFSHKDRFNYIIYGEKAS